VSGEVAKRWKGNGERLEMGAGIKEVGTESEREILVKLVRVKSRLTKLGRKQGMDC